MITEADLDSFLQLQHKRYDALETAMKAALNRQEAVTDHRLRNLRLDILGVLMDTTAQIDIETRNLQERLANLED